MTRQMETISLIIALLILATPLAQAAPAQGRNEPDYRNIDKLVAEGRSGEAEALLRKHLSRNKDDYAAMTRVGLMCQDRGDKRAAARLFSDAIKINPDYPMAHFFLGRLYFLTQKDEEAAGEFELFKEKMAKTPLLADEAKATYIKDLYYVSDVYYSLKRYEDFRKTVEDILRMDPNDAYAHYNLGVYYYKCAHDRPKAFRMFNKTMELSPGTDIAKKAKYAIEFIRINPDSRIAPDFSFIDREYR
jgi:tetratricopeptide (TPR) repeat protein